MRRTDGDTILIAQGTYAENVHVHDDGLTYAADTRFPARSGCRAWVRRSSKAPENESIFRIDGRNVVLKQLTITGAQNRRVRAAPFRFESRSIR